MSIAKRRSAAAATHRNIKNKDNSCKPFGLPPGEHDFWKNGECGRCGTRRSNREAGK